MKIYKTLTIWALVAASGCLDLNLLDEMHLFDAGNQQEIEPENNTGGNSDGDGDAELDGNGDSNVDPDSTLDSDDNGDPVDVNEDTDDSGNEVDTVGPAIVASTCLDDQIEEQHICISKGNGSVALNFVTDEPSQAELELTDGGVGQFVDSDFSQEHLGIIVSGQKGQTQTVSVVTKDIMGNASRVTVELEIGQLPPIAITEVFANPFGPEPAQEFVEVANFGSTQVDISGWMLDDNSDVNGDIIPEGTVLRGHSVALLVSENYDSTGPDDPMPPLDSVIVYLEGAICSGGLKNSEAESVYLYDATGQIVSSYQGEVGKPKEGLSAVRRWAELPSSFPRAWHDEPMAATPGVTEMLNEYLP